MPRLEHRQALEREYGDAPFVHGEMLERVLAEFEVVDIHGSGHVMGQVYHGVTRRGERVLMNFPSATAMSHMWLDPSHPDPEAKNLREIWLPALEWYFSERVRKLAHRDRAVDAATGKRLSDEAVLAAADFGIFIDLASMHQKEGDARQPAEDALFRHALNNLDVLYAHKYMASFLSTRVPKGVKVRRGYEDRGWCNFERGMGFLIKAHTLCIDIGCFSVEMASKEARRQIDDTPLAQLSVDELAEQGSSTLLKLCSLVRVHNATKHPIDIGLSLIHI